MKTKTLFSLLLLAFVVVSVVFAFRKVAPEASSNSEQATKSDEASITTTPVGLQAKLAESQFSAVYFHELFGKIAHEQNAGVIVVTHDHRFLDVSMPFMKWKMESFMSPISAQPTNFRT